MGKRKFSILAGSGVGFLIVIVLAVRIDYKFFPIGPESPAYSALYLAKVLFLFVGIAGLAFLVNRKGLNFPAAVLLIFYAWLVADKAFERDLYTGPFFAAAILGIVGAGKLVIRHTAFRLLYFVPALTLIASLVYYIFEPEKSFRTGWYSDYFGELPVGLFMGIANHPNVFAPLIALAILLAIPLGVSKASLWLVVPASVGLVWSGSDGTFAALVMASTAMFIERDLSLGRRGKAAWRGVLASFVAIGFIFWTLAIIYRSGPRVFTSGRTEILAAIVEEGEAGLEAIPFAEDAHNAWFHLYLNGGPVAIALAVTFWLVLAAAIWHLPGGQFKTLALGLFVFLNLHGLVEISWANPGINVATIMLAVAVSSTLNAGRAITS